MKKAVFLFIFLGTSVLGFSQRYAIIDTKYILDKLSDYKDAQKQLDDIAAGWQKEIDAQQQELDRMYKTLRPSR
jgi:outer membrane protein